MRAENHDHVFAGEELNPYRAFEIGLYCIGSGKYEEAISAFVRPFELLDAREGRIPLIKYRYMINAAIRLVFCCQRSRENDAADRLLSAIDEYISERTYDGEFADVKYQMCILALLKVDRETAFAELRKNIELDRIDFVPLQLGETFDSPLFDPLSGDSGFEALTAEYERRRAANAQKVRALIRAAGY